MVVEMFKKTGVCLTQEDLADMRRILNHPKKEEWQDRITKHWKLIKSKYNMNTKHQNKRVFIDYDSSEVSVLEIIDIDDTATGVEV